MKKLFCSLLIAFALITARGSDAATYYVNPAGSIGNSCTTATSSTPSNAKPTIASGAACLAANNGDILEIAGGTYNETAYSIALPASSSFADGPTIRNKSGEVVILNRWPFDVYNNAATAYVTWDGTNGISRGGIVVDGRNGADGFGQDGINVGKAHHLRFYGLEIKGWSANGMQLTTSNVEVRGCYIHDSGTSDFDHGVYINDQGDGVSQNNVVDGCEFYKWAGAAVQAYHNGSGTVISNNYAHNGGGGIHRTANTDNGPLGNQNRGWCWIAYSGATKVFNNICSTLDSGSEVIALEIAGGPQQVYSNTVYGVPYGVRTDATAGHQIKNNIFANISIQQFVPNGSTAGFSNNLCSTSGTNCNIVGDPSFANASAGDFRLGSGSPAINAGAALSSEFATDRAGTARPQGAGWDIGAYEYVSSGSAPVITITAPTAQPTYQTASATVDMAGTASASAGVTSVTWSNNRGGSGTASGDVAWSISAVPLQFGTNIVTVTVHDGAGGTASDSITITRPAQGDQLVLALALNEGTGTTAADSSGLGNDGAFGSGVTWDASGKYGSALSFDGTGSLTVPAASSLDLTSAGMTLEAWIYPTSATAGFQAILAKNYVYWLYSATDPALCGSLNRLPAGGFSTGALDAFACGNAIVALNTWQHIAVTYDGVSVKFYRDGALISSTTSSLALTASTGSLQIGASQYGENFIGKIDDVRIYNYARSAAQIAIDRDTPVGGSTMVIRLGAGSSIKLGAASTIQVGQ